MALLCYRRHRFPPEISQHAIWLYLRFTLSYRDVEVLVAERRLDLSHETMRRWVLKFNAGSFPKPHAGQRQRCPALATETPRRCILLDPAAQANSEHSVQLDRRAHRRTADRSLRCESRRWQLCREPCGNAPRKGRPAAAGEGGIEPARPDQQLDHAYQQGRADHIGTFPPLEDQMANLTSDIDRVAVGYSPDRG